MKRTLLALGTTGTLLLGTAGAQGALTIDDLLLDIANDNGGTPFVGTFDFNDDSVGDLFDSSGAEIANPTATDFAAGNSIEGLFTIGDIDGNQVGFNNSTNPFQVSGDYVFDITAVDGSITGSGVETVGVTVDAMFRIFEDSASEANTPVTVNNDDITGSPSDFIDGSHFATLVNEAYLFTATFVNGNFNQANLTVSGQSLDITDGSILSSLVIQNPSVSAEATTVSPGSGGEFTFTDTATFQLSATIIPSPTAGLAGLGLLGLGLMKRRRA